MCVCVCVCVCVMLWVMESIKRIWVLKCLTIIYADSLLQTLLGCMLVELHASIDMMQLSTISHMASSSIPLIRLFLPISRRV